METDVATFGASNISDIIVGGATDLQDADTNLSEIVFSPDASTYTISATPGSSDTIYSRFIIFFGAGVVNDSGKVQNFITQGAPGPEPRDPSSIWFESSSSAGENVVITNQGSAVSGTVGGFTRFGLQFADAPSAGKATFINEGGRVSGTSYGGVTNVLDYSTADSATFINQPGEVDGAAAGITYVYTGGNIGSSTFINNAATVTGAEGGWTEIDLGISAGASFIANGATSAGPQGGQVYTYGGSGYASFTAKGGRGNGAQGGLIEIHNIANSNQTVVTAEGGIQGGLGGMIVITVSPTTLDQVQFQLSGNGTLEVTDLYRQNTVTIGSLSGEGIVSLGGFTLNVASNNLDTTFAGVIEESGILGKTGSGKLTLSGANSYSGSTSVTAGTLVVANQSGSATGTGAVKIRAGTLGGNGIIAGSVTVGTGSGTGAFVAPAAASNKPTALTLQSKLTLNAGSTYTCTFKAKRNKARADLVTANGVTIASGASVTLLGQTNGSLRRGLALTLISNTSANPISGTFGNLPNGAIVNVNGNNLQASYSGGDGNDLTLTVVP